MSETNFKGHTITRQQVLDALQEFRNKYPDPNSYEEGLEKDSYKYAIEYDGRLYPPKIMLSNISGESVATYSGGEQTNRVFRELGFAIVDKK
jgi:hypothetical protein